MINLSHTDDSEGNAPLEDVSDVISNDELFFLNTLKDLCIPFIRPQFTSHGVKYDSIADLVTYYSEEELTRLLESLTRKGIVDKIDYGVVIMCPECESPNHMTLLVCPKCNSTKVRKKEKIRHHPCGYWGDLGEFMDVFKLTCPSCEQTLDESKVGEDFSISDPYYECQDCDSLVPKNSLGLICNKCSKIFLPRDSNFTNPVGYRINEITPERLERLRVSNVSVVTSFMPKLEAPVEDDEVYDIPEALTEPSPEPVVEATPEPQTELIPEPTPEKKIEPSSESIVEPVTVPEPKYETPIHMETEPEAPESEAIIPAVEAVVKEPPVDMSVEIEPPKETFMFVSEPAPRLEPEPIEQPVVEPVSPQPVIKETVVLEEEPRVEPEAPQPIIHEKVEQTVEPISEPEEPKRVIKETVIQKKETQVEPVEPEPTQPPAQERREQATYHDYEVRPKRVSKEVVSNPKVLLVEEDQMMADIIIDILGDIQKPFEIYHVGNGVQAFKELRRHFNAVILDMELKSTKSIQLLQEMEKWKIKTPIYLLSNMGNVPKFKLNIQGVLKKKQSEYKKLREILYYL
ncbi:MAG: response regulator [Candidatus Bathyarchaeota archaeon]|nr:response regulator [Candidatus Bathyarchaeota archaeon]